jgi:oxygen-independent coproporphyrinogen III oxidase
MSNYLAEKYNQPVPRYTSYPTVPFWNDIGNAEQWTQVFRQRFDEENHTNGISIYIHLPFCESLCTYCGCNKKITTNHSVEAEYIDALEKEWLMYRKLMDSTPVISELHIGGGTPTFFSPVMLEKIINIILKGSIRHPRYEFSIEGHPNNTTDAHLEILARLGFKRISFGVQDNDPDVQKVINRIQPLKNVEYATANARKWGFKSVNFDLIYGLPLQTVSSINRTMNEVLALRPDRIAFYSYAHVPWTSRSQRLFDESHLPSAQMKLDIYAEGRAVLQQAGYEEIGMDHFAMPADDLCLAMKSGKLHRNFMGYTIHRSRLLVGLGMSAISDAGNAFVQNNKTLHQYYADINEGRLAINKGYFLSELDVELRKYITDICCRNETHFSERYRDVLVQHSYNKLADLANDGLIDWTENGLKVTTIGRRYIRNICSAFDLFLQSFDNKKLFSKAI